MEYQGCSHTVKSQSRDPRTGDLDAVRIRERDGQRMGERHTDHACVAHNQNMLTRVSGQDAFDPRRDARQKNIQRFSALRSCMNGIGFETRQRAGPLELNLFGRLAFPDAKSDFFEARLEFERQAVLLRERFGKGATAQ